MMRFKASWGVLGLLLVVLIIVLGGCGGGSGARDTNIGGDDGPPAGVVGDIAAPPEPGDYPVAQPITGASPEAPLGTNPAYDVQEGAAVEVSHTPSKASSALDAGQSVKIDWITITPRGGVPDPDATNLAFDEGTFISLWAQYEVAPNTEFSRIWSVAAAGLDYTESSVLKVAGGVYTVRFDFGLPADSATDNGLFSLELGPPKMAGAIVTPDISDAAQVNFVVNEVAGGVVLEYPEGPVDDSLQACEPAWIHVTFSDDATQVYVECEKELSNVVLKFSDFTTQKWDNLSGYTGTYYGTGANSGKELMGCWVKSGCNASGDGPGYGEWYPIQSVNRQAMMCWEDLLVNSDYDYNDMVASMHATEYRNAANELYQIDLFVKALARGAGYTADWQFNVEQAFPGRFVVATVDQYYANGTRHGNQRLWTSANGASVPVFSPTRLALPIPPDHSFATNVVPNTTYIEGDYALVTVMIDPPIALGEGATAPYYPELRVQPNQGQVYCIGLWRKKGDPVDSNGRPLGFIVPDTWAWPLETKKLWNAYPAFTDWVKWINNQLPTPPNPAWTEREPVKDYFLRSLFK